MFQFTRKFLAFLFILLSPFFFLSLSLKVAFTEPFLEIVYIVTDIPENGTPKEEKLKIAKLGLKAVLSDEGMQEFINSGLFNKREILHMQDVKELLSKVFTVGYLVIALWLILIVLLKSKLQLAKLIFFSSLFSEIVLLVFFLIAYVFFDQAFELFHLVFFDPYSWRFYPGDMLIDIYPLNFWKNAFVSLFLLYMLKVNIALGVAIFFLTKTKSITLDK